MPNRRTTVRRPHRSRVALTLVVGATLAAACGGSESPVEIGFRRVALDLAFKDAEKALPVPAAQVITQYLDAEYEIEEYEEPETRRVVRRFTPPPAPPKRECPVAPDGSTPARDAFAVVKEPPKVGTYPRHNEGALTIALGGAIPFDIPVPALSKWDIPTVGSAPFSTVLNDRDVEELDPPAQVRANETAFPEAVEFQMTRRLLPGYSTTDTYRYIYTGGDDDYLHLVKRVTVARGVETVFEPTPPVRLVRLGATEGDAVDAGVVHAGVDRKTNIALAVQSQVVEREYVDVCGEIADTYRVQIKEQFVDLSKTPPQTSGNEGDATNYWNIQFDNGLLIVREEVNSTLRTTAQVLGQPVPLVVTYKYTSTLDKLEPDPLGASPFAQPTPQAAPTEEEVEDE